MLIPIITEFTEKTMRNRLAKLMLMSGLLCFVLGTWGSIGPVQAKNIPKKEFERLTKKAPKRVVKMFYEKHGTVKSAKRIKMTVRSGIFLMPVVGLYEQTYGDGELNMQRITLSRKRSDTACHELGHSLDYMYGDSHPTIATSTNEWKKIYKKEKHKRGITNPRHAKSNSQEFFAESFSMYCLHRGRLKRSYPKTYRYLKKIIKTF